jgi:uncharacterized protein (TIGR02145 family)
MKKFILVFAVVCCALLVITGEYDPVSADNDTGTVTDIDGNVYQTVKIGNQVWTVENLRTTRYNDGISINLITDSAAWSKSLIRYGAAWSKASKGAYCYYNNMTDADSIKKYGALYNWYAIDTKKLAPKGWHVPTNAEWDTLQNYLIANGYNWDGTTTGNKIAKSMAAQTDWKTDTNPGATGNDLFKNNKSGFSALPGGWRFFIGFLTCLAASVSGGVLRRTLRQTHVTVASATTTAPSAGASSPRVAVFPSGC